MLQDSVGSRRTSADMLKLVDLIDMINPDTRRRWEKILQEYMADYQRIMDDIESDNAKIEKQSSEIEEKRNLVKIKMAMAESLAEYH